MQNIYIQTIPHNRIRMLDQIRFTNAITVEIILKKNHIQKFKTDCIQMVKNVITKPT